MHFNLSEKAPPSGFHIRCNYLYIPQQHSRAHRDLTVSSRRVSLWSRTFPCSQVELCRKDLRPREALPAGRGDAAGAGPGADAGAGVRLASGVPAWALTVCVFPSQVRP